MPTKIQFNSESLLNLKFDKNVKGYDAYQVDVALDRVILDYRFYESFYREAKEYIAKLEKDVKRLADEGRKKDVELAKYKNRFDGIKDDSNVSKENLSLLRRIDKLERELYAHGVDPNKIK
ncbi:MAG: DivIVA domain-containing protein [Bacilli bacterium]|nr:DivIVA domain-containing protein [Bacilli bacterium]